MSFRTDKQTLDDLNIMGKPGSNTIYNLFNVTRTRGGAEILEKMFLYPLSDSISIKNRIQTLQYFQSLKTDFPFKTEYLDAIEAYMNMTDQRTVLSPEENVIKRKFNQFLASDSDYKAIYGGVVSFIDLLHSLRDFIDYTLVLAKLTPYYAELSDFIRLLNDLDFQALLQEKNEGKLSYEKVVSYDNTLRFRSRFKIKQFLAGVYQMDVYISIANLAEQKKLVFPSVLENFLDKIVFEGLYHPLVQDAVPNTLPITPDSNVIFLTGANMAGKSTFMKSMGIAVYLAHMGFPVPAVKMQFSVRDGIYTTINLPDDLHSGNSHFYAEVLRIKTVAKELGTAKKLFVIFDELFRGTNVKDAYEATIAITEAFAEKRNCIFVVSTHIIEAGEVLKRRCENINFVYLPTLMNGNTPVYTYSLRQGITTDRHGMVIINNERIIEIIKSRNLNKSIS